MAVNRHLGEFAREVEALRDVLALIDRFGEEHAANLVLTGGQDDDHLTGVALIPRARGVAAVPAD